MQTNDGERITCYVAISEHVERQESQIAAARRVCEAVGGTQFQEHVSIPPRPDRRGWSGDLACSFTTHRSPGAVGQAVLDECMDGTFVGSDGIPALGYPFGTQL